MEIESLTIGVPKHALDRSLFVKDATQLESFEKLTGIKKTRRWHKPDSGDLFGRVEAKIKKESICAVIYVTQSPFRLSPCCAVDVHHSLKLPSNIPVFDVNQSCDGFIYGLWLARKILMGATDQDRVLMVCFDALRFSKTPVESLIFSDAISFTVVRKEYGTRNFHSHFHTNGAGASVLFAGRDGQMAMDGGKVFDFVTKNVPNQIQEYERSCLPLGFDYLCQHQANLSMMKIVDKRSGFSSKSLYSIEEYGNQSMVSIPTALAYNEQSILGKNILLAGYGAGWCTAVTGIKWSAKMVSEIIEV